MSARTTVKLSPEVEDVLLRSEIGTTTLKLPEQLDRKLYMAVNKVITLAGGRWHKGQGLHVFDRDPREVLGLALTSGEIVDEKKLFQFYPTPREAADVVWEMAEVGPDMHLLEPSAGNGGLLKAIPENFFRSPMQIHAVELNPAHTKAIYAEIERIAKPSSDYGIVACPYDFLTMYIASPRFDRIIMNPPFTKGQAKQHVKHAWQFLAPGGRLVAILPGELTETSPFLMDFDTTDINCYPLPEGTFKESGTNIKTTIVTLDK